MEQVQTPSGEKFLVTLLSGDAEGMAERISGPSVLEVKLSSDDHHGSAPAINLLNSLENILRNKPDRPKRNFNNSLATRAYGCKYCKAKFDTLQSLGGHQNAHRRQRAAERQAKERTWNTYAFSQANPYFDPSCFGVQAIPVPGHPMACRPRARPRAFPAPTNVVEPTYGWTLKRTMIMNPQASAWPRPAMANQLNGMAYRPMNYNGDPHFCTKVPPQSTGPRPPFANVFANGSSSGTQGLENGGLDLSLRL
ncbi:zinc finger protein 8-like [Eucalyptus grandis]|uniref:zinc finger protein 8-like n=1 Tax=Eucalyptus grandis TaxID=71139 RepID=UPI000527F00A|nr:zinc finger protein 8-like [Eucalyptus grandis]